jgi:uncharacterized protein
MSSQPVEVKEIKPIPKGEYRALLGFAGAGFIGNTAAMFIVRSKGFQQTAFLRSTHIPPMTLITNGVPIQSFRVHLDENNKIILVVTESLIPAEGCWPIAEALLKWLKGKGVQEIYSLDGLPFSAVSSEIKALTYTHKIDLAKQGIPAVREGALSGVNSCVLEQCVEKDFPYACIFVPTNKLTSIDYSGSADGVDVLNKILKFGVDSSPLRASEEAHRRAIEQKQSGIGKMFKRD